MDRSKIDFFLKKYNLLLGAIGFTAVIIICLYRGIQFSNKLNSNSKLCFAEINKVSEEYYSYHYIIKKLKYEGSLSNNEVNNLKINDKIIIQYFTKNPTFHIVYSIKRDKSIFDLSLLPKKKVQIWDAW